MYYTKALLNSKIGVVRKPELIFRAAALMLLTVFKITGFISLQHKKLSSVNSM